MGECNKVLFIMPFVIIFIIIIFILVILVWIETRTEQRQNLNPGIIDLPLHSFLFLLRNFKKFRWLG